MSFRAGAPHWFDWLFGSSRDRPPLSEFWLDEVPQPRLLGAGDGAGAGAGFRELPHDADEGGDERLSERAELAWPQDLPPEFVLPLPLFDVPPPQEFASLAASDVEEDPPPHVLDVLPPVELAWLSRDDIAELDTPHVLEERDPPELVPELSLVESVAGFPEPHDDDDERPQVFPPEFSAGLSFADEDSAD